MLPDTIAYDTQRSGLYREGTFTSVYSLMEKCAFALGPLLVGAILEAAGFEPGQTGDASPEVVRAILLAAAVLPALASLLSGVVLVFYRLDRELHGFGENQT